MGILDFLRRKPTTSVNDVPTKGKVDRASREEMERARDILNAQGLDTTGVFPALERKGKKLS